MCTLVLFSDAYCKRPLSVGECVPVSLLNSLSVSRGFPLGFTVNLSTYCILSGNEEWKL